MKEPDLDAIAKGVAAGVKKRMKLFEEDLITIFAVVQELESRLVEAERRIAEMESAING